MPKTLNSKTTKVANKKVTKSTSKRSTAKKVVTKKIAKNTNRAKKSFAKKIPLVPVTRVQREFIAAGQDSHSKTLMNNKKLAGYTLHQVARVKGWANPDGDFNRLTNSVLQKDYAAGLVKFLTRANRLFSVMTKGTNTTM